MPEPRPIRRAEVDSPSSSERRCDRRTAAAQRDQPKHNAQNNGELIAQGSLAAARISTQPGALRTISCRIIGPPLEERRSVRVTARLRRRSCTRFLAQSSFDGISIQQHWTAWRVAKNAGGIDELSCGDDGAAASLEPDATGEQQANDYFSQRFQREHGPMEPCNDGQGRIQADRMDATGCGQRNKQPAASSPRGAGAVDEPPPISVAQLILIAGRFHRNCVFETRTTHQLISAGVGSSQLSGARHELSRVSSNHDWSAINQQWLSGSRVRLTRFGRSLLSAASVS